MKKLMFFALLAMATMAQGKTLVVYYSFTNNIETIANDLVTQIDADVLEVEPAEEGLDYAANNYAIGSNLIAAIRANPDDASSYPAIKTTISNLDDYDIIIIATPLWWSNMAAPMQSFLFNYSSQMAGKQIRLIVSSASSGISGVVSDAKRLIPNGNFFSENLWIRSSQTSNCHTLIANWLSKIDYSTIAAIRNIDIENNSENDATYTLNGIRTNNIIKGVYIKNGKKFVY